MRKALQFAASLLLLSLTACFHFHHKNPPDQTLAPPPLETTQVENAPPPAQPAAQTAQQPDGTAATPATPPSEQQATAPAATSPDQAAKHPPATHHKRPETKPVEEASSGAPEVPAIGQLSPGDPSDLRADTESSLSSIDNAVKKINRPLSDQEQKTVAQIREFLKQARAALASGDVDGAHTLALKAKILLNEITR